jgi:salicylate hydroxylase
MSAKQHIVIAGLTAALALLRAGFDVTICEQAPVLGEVGAGVQISANGTRVLHALGLAEAVARIAWEPEGKVIRLWDTGERWPLFDLGAESTARYGFPYHIYHRADLHGVLVAAVRGLKPQAIHLNAAAAGVDQDDHGATLILADSRRVRGDALIGADGVHSVVRASLFGPDAPEFTGCMAWRGIVPAARLPKDRFPPVGTNWIGPGGHVVHYYLRGGALMNLVAVREGADWSQESWSTVGTVADCLADFEGGHTDVRTLIGNIETPYKWALMGREPMERWSLGRVGLVGDACHPTLPFLAQGAVMAIEDGFMLARSLTAHGDDIPAALERLAAARHARTAKIVRGSAANTALFHHPMLASRAAAADFVADSFHPERVHERYDWLFTYDATTAPI